ncbi:MAG: hypothetical protein LBT54_04560 [Bifidobacteriaceae bacterium]|jgi:hypothetical protein|nr:hypothetical protein [Bifidobacteriaceae bacterium]
MLGVIEAARPAQRLGVFSRQAERAIKGWKDRGVLTREDPAKGGRWNVSAAADTWALAYSAGRAGIGRRLREGPGGLD